MTIIMSNRHHHHATGPDMLRMRIDRLAVLANDQIEAGLIWLAGQRPEVFDAVVNAARVWDDGCAWEPVPIAS
jgi:hypothetical protein